MGSCRLGYPRFLHGFFHRLLQNGLVQMVPAFLSGCAIYVVARCRKYPLPSPLFSRIGIFALEGVRQSNAAHAVLEIAPELLFHEFELLSEGVFHRPGKHRVPVFIALTRANDNLVTREIYIFDPQLQTLHQSEARSVKKHGHEPIGMIEDTEDRFHFLSCQNHR